MRKPEGLQPNSEIIVTIEEVSPLRNTRNGNTVQRVRTKDGALYVTAPDSHAGQVATNYRGKRVALTLNYAGKISGIREA